MSRDLNKVMIIGNLGRDPEMRYTPAGKPVTNFSVGVTRQWTGSDGDHHEHTEWFNVVAWAGLAEICNQHLAKGDRVYLEGRLQTRQWQDAEGEDQRMTELVAQEMIMLGAAGSKAPVSSPAQEQEEHS
jgi:single-strand DNA-binding protein